MKKLLKRIAEYLADVWSELGKVSWVKRKELLTTTLVVIVFSTVMALFIAVVDIVFSQLLQLVLR
ncbi:preprotein translocase subunit SecE [candidate division WOR-3 bacterium]|nr:preprotein translocase subunit SecE [candidate division WOR-3 bacterium]